MFTKDINFPGSLRKYLFISLLLIIFIAFTGCDSGMNSDIDGTGDLTIIYDYSYFESEIPEEEFFVELVNGGMVSILQGTTIDERDFTLANYTAEATFLDLETGTWNITGELLNSDQEVLFQDVSECEVTANQVKNQTVKVEPTWTVTIDKQEVAAGGEVTIHVGVSVNDKNYTGVRITWKLRDPDGNFYKGGSWVTCTNKTISIPSNGKTGEWEIAIYYKGEKVGFKKVDVQ
ncbi:MAG: hypothetical protein K9K32_05620 [Halanaerobiales bacterium]|nr:hypothetical protein [Halanaerobiales bacterium]